MTGCQVSPNENGGAACNRMVFLFSIGSVQVACADAFSLPVLGKPQVVAATCYLGLLLPAGGRTNEKKRGLKVKGERARTSDGVFRLRRTQPHSGPGVPPPAPGVSGLSPVFSRALPYLSCTKHVTLGEPAQTRRSATSFPARDVVRLSQCCSAKAPRLLNYMGRAHNGDFTGGKKTAAQGP